MIILGQDQENQENHRGREKGVEGSQVQQGQNGGFEGQYPNALFGYGCENTGILALY